MRILALLIILLAIPPAWGAQVCNVTDGDTIRLCDGQAIRLFGIDAPELRQPYSIEARDALRDLVLGQEVRLECSGQHWKRRVCSVYVDSIDVAGILVARGLAFDYRQYSRGRYQETENEAQRQKLGVWQIPCGGVRPWDYRRGK